MKKYIHKLAVTVVMAALAMTITYGISSAQPGPGISEEELGIRKSSLYSETDTTPVRGKYPTMSPGESKRFMRSFENSPPLIPHDISGMLPIALTSNQCASCHMPKTAKLIGAIPVPRSHLMDLETGMDLKGELDGKRYNCMQCHVQQVTIPVAIENTFKEEFRDERSRYNSNLAEILNEGAEVNSR